MINRGVKEPSVTLESSPEPIKIHPELILLQPGRESPPRPILRRFGLQ